MRCLDGVIQSIAVLFLISGALMRPEKPLGVVYEVDTDVAYLNYRILCIM